MNSNNWYLAIMKMINTCIAVLLTFTTTTIYSQIEISGDTQPVDTLSKAKKRKPVEQKKSTTEFFAIANWSSTSRKLIENPTNGGLFGKSLGERENETKLNTWSFGIGIKDRIHQYLTWEGGISFLRNGEQYSYETDDTSFTYTTTYSYISMPVKLYFTYGDNIRLMAGGGLIPQMFLKYKQDRKWVDINNTETTENYSTQNGYNSFVLTAVANIGVHVSMGKGVSLLFMPEYRIQLTSSNIKESAYQHFGRALGFNVGLSYFL